MSQPPEIEVLLAEDGWMRRLARGLVADPHRAEDLAQEAWLTALRRPASGRAPRAWLAGVLRNLRRSGARTDGRRDHHERAAARDAQAPDAADLVSEIELRREVADLLLALAEPYRAAVFLRFFRDLPLKEIAARTGVPISTAHARVQRGLALLRAALDREHGGERGAWALALVPLVRGTPAATGGSAATATGASAANLPGGVAAGVTAALGPAAAATVGAIAMTTGAKVASALVAAAFVLGLYLKTDGAGSRASSAPASAAAPPSAREPDVALVPVADGGAPTRSAVPAADPTGVPAADESAEPPPAATFVDGRVIDTARRPLPGVRVDVVGDGGATIASEVADAEGSFRFPRVDAPGEVGWVMPSMKALVGGRPQVRDGAHALLAVGLDARGTMLVVAEPQADFAGVVVDAGAGSGAIGAPGAAGGPLAGASVTVRVRQELYRELGLVGFESPERDAWAVTTGGDGAFQIDGACGGGRVFLDVALAGYAPREVALPPFGSTDLVVELLRRDDAIDVVGRVVDARGAAVEDARVSMGEAIERTDADGRFRIRWSAREAIQNATFSKMPDGVYAKTFDPLHVAAVKPGLLPAWRDLEERELAEPLLLRLGPAPLAISGRVVDRDGEPVEGVAVWELDPHRLGKELLQQGEVSTTMDATIEEVLRGGGSGDRGALTGADGRFTLEGLMEGEYTLRAVHPARMTAAPDVAVEAGATGVEIELAEAQLERVAGRVVSATGAPIAGVEVTPHRTAPGRYPYSELPRGLARSATTDADGRFDLGDMAVEGARLQLFGERIFFRSIALDDQEDPAALEIVEPLLCELQVELVDPDAGITHLRFEDGAGQELDIVESYGVYVTTGRSASVRDGRSGVLRVPETARTLVLWSADGQLGRRPLALDPEHRTDLRL